MRSSDWSSDVCSSDLFNFTVSPTDASGQAISIYVDIAGFGDGTNTYLDLVGEHTAYSVFPEALSTSQNVRFGFVLDYDALVAKVGLAANGHRSEEHTSELQSLMRISYAVFFLKKQ